MALAPGTRLGPYEIGPCIGVGGMGEVYRATDVNLGRHVAIKVLPQSGALDSAAAARLTREARLLASINHRHIAIIHGLERAGGIDAIVMELIEGPTLAERIQGGPLPIAEALRIALEIADALEAAHEQGILHRDLKPANIKLAKDGSVKVLDFGLAKPDARLDGGDRAREATVSATMPGTILGTAPYMSPEQASGDPVDRGTDVWAFACVLYEMLSGRRAFTGNSSTEILAAVLKSDPDWSLLPGSTPESIQRLLRRGLQKNLRSRLRDIRDARLEIDDAIAPPAHARLAAAVWWKRAVWAAAVAATAMAAVFLGSRLAAPLVQSPQARLEINTPPTRSSGIAVSPDGRSIAYSAIADGQARLWLRPLDSLSARPLPGTEDGIAPFWSPDGGQIAFFADSKLKRIDIERDSVSIIHPIVEVAMGGAWHRDGFILTALRPGTPLVRIPVDGGTPEAVTTFQTEHRGYSSPQFLPDGRHFLFFAGGTAETRGVHIGNIDRMETRRLFNADAPAVYFTGHLLFVRDRTLWAQAFDTGRLETTAEPVVVAEGVGALTTASASPAGTIAYRTLPADIGRRQLAWFDRQGRESDREVYEDTASLGPAVSPDGRRVAVFRFANGNMDLWSYERSRRLWERLTVHPRDDIFPLWTPDGRQLVFAASGDGGLNLYIKELGTQPGHGEQLLFSSGEAKWPMDVSPDGRFVLYTNLTTRTGADVWSLPLTGARTPREVVATQFTEQLPQFSPDGKWIAYQSNQTGRFEVYVREFGATGNDVRISTAGGTQPRWAGDELFYIAPDDWLMSVPIRFAPAGGIDPGAAVRVFATNVGSSAPNLNRQQYAVSPDGRSFVMNSTVAGAVTPPIVVMLNWRP